MSGIQQSPISSPSWGEWQLSTRKRNIGTYCFNISTCHPKPLPEKYKDTGLARLVLWDGFPLRTPDYDLRRRLRSATRSLAPTPAARKVFKVAWGPKEPSLETKFKFSNCLGDTDVSVTIALKPCLTPALELKGAGPLTQIIVGFVLLLSSCLS